MNDDFLRSSTSGLQAAMPTSHASDLYPYYEKAYKYAQENKQHMLQMEKLLADVGKGKTEFEKYYVESRRCSLKSLSSKVCKLAKNSLRETPHKLDGKAV